MEAALESFAARGYEATSVADLARACNMSKAAFSYHFRAKEDLLAELVAPALDRIEGVLAAHPGVPRWPDGVRALLADYVDALLEHQRVVGWVDRDMALLRIDGLSIRLSRSDAAVRRAVTGGGQGAAAELAGAAALAVLRGPLRDSSRPIAARHAYLLVEIAMAAAAAARQPAMGNTPGRARLI